MSYRIRARQFRHVFTCGRPKHTAGRIGNRRVVWSEDRGFAPAGPHDTFAASLDVQVK